MVYYTTTLMVYSGRFWYIMVFYGILYYILVYYGDYTGSWFS